MQMTPKHLNPLEQKADQAFLLGLCQQFEKTRQDQDVPSISP